MTITIQNVIKERYLGDIVLVSLLVVMNGSVRSVNEVFDLCAWEKAKSSNSYVV